MTTPISPSAPSEHVRNIAMDLVLTILTCGLFNVYVQARQIAALNDMLREPKYSFGKWFLLSLVTCGIYHVYHEYRKTTDLVAIVKGASGNEPLICLLLSFFGLTFVADAIQQSLINRHHGSTAL